MQRKIETNCFAIVRATGCPVIVGRKLGNRLCGFVWETDCGEYTGHELRRVDEEGYRRAEYAADVADFDALCQLLD